MSNAGQAALGIVGGVIGFMVGGPTGALYGFQLGVLAGTALFPTQLPGVQGPRIGDGGQTVSQVGAPIPWLVGGTDVVGGIVMWASPIREVAQTESVGGKGAPEQDVTTYHYYRSWAILLNDGQIGGVRRIWANGKLVYDRSVPPGYTVDEIIAEGPFSDIFRQLVAQLATTNEYGDKLTVHLGTEDQMPDPVIESFEGVGNVPGFRGYAYAVFNDVELKSEDGNRIPAQWRFEIFEEGTTEDGEVEEYANEYLMPWRASAVDPRRADGSYLYTITASGFAPYDDIIGEEFDSLEAAVSRVQTRRGQAFDTPQGYNVPGNVHVTASTGPVASVAPPIGKSNDWSSVTMHFNREAPRLGYKDTSPISLCCDTMEEFGFGPQAYGWTLHGYGCFANQANGIGGLYVCADPNLGLTPGYDFRIYCVDIDGGYDVDYLSDCGIRVQRLVQAPQDPCARADAVPMPGYTGVCVVDGRLQLAGAWTYDDTRAFKVLQKTTGLTDTSLVQRYPLSPVLPSGHPLYNDQDFWESAYEVAVALGWMPAGMTYNVEYPQVQAYAYVRTVDYSLISTLQVSLADLVARICERVGLVAYDVSDLESTLVTGFQISRPMTARAAIEPLRSVGFFDAVESVIALKFPQRGKASVAQLEYDDLGAHFAGETRPPLSTSDRFQEVELPLQLRVHFKNPLRDYDSGEELSPARFDTEAKTPADIELAVAMLPTLAAQVAEVLFRDLWASRTTHGTSVDVSQSHLEPADAFELPIDDQYQRVRITALTEKLPNLRILEMVRDDDGAYTSTAVGTTPGNQPRPIALYGPVESLFLDLPALEDTHDDGGFYVAARPLIIGGSFRGALIQRSLDGGASFTTIGSAVEATPIGTLVADVAAGPTTIFDTGNEIRVDMQQGMLETRDVEDVLAGANAAAIGADGRWEIVQFADAEVVAGTVFRASTLLRGRRGTEHAVGTAIAGDRFVLLSVGSLVRVPLGVADLNGPIKYRVSAIGSSPELVDPFDFTAHGIALKPFSPVHIEASRDGDGNIAIDWLRRDRLHITDLDPPMSESVEDYEVDVLDVDGSVVRTISSSTSSTDYSVDQQVTDFDAVQSSVWVRVYQISVAVGRGYAGEAVI